LAWSKYQDLHEKATDAPGYLFDKSKIGCWAAVVKIGRSNDVRWATEEEFLEAFPPIRSANAVQSQPVSNSDESANKQEENANREPAD
jgi:hypothetical protein